MSAEITRVEALTSAQKQTLYRTGIDHFGARHLKPLGLKYRKKTATHLLHVNGELAGAYGTLTTTVTINGHPRRVGGMGGLLVLPPWQGHGYGRELTRAALHDLKIVRGVEAVLAFCLDHVLAFHEKLGGLRIEAAVVIDRPSGPMGSPFHLLIWPSFAGITPVESIDVGGYPW